MRASPVIGARGPGTYKSSAKNSSHWSAVSCDDWLKKNPVCLRYSGLDRNNYKTMWMEEDDAAGRQVFNLPHVRACGSCFEIRLPIISRYILESTIIMSSERRLVCSGCSKPWQPTPGIIAMPCKVRKRDSEMSNSQSKPTMPFVIKQLDTLES